ncbi:MgtC/SapB family protein [Actinacidiphila guanduensis]|uniref:Putative Mg2+ transporter-C (MgtC) family protein n=1 Tax=Actinacidiphila guanduensis TaxID=310781 RepID=A0A1H0BK89_9ACTN|nr:MgtC/SapB family protein [Actinacidiphila guanduensis]SDN46084.1 putative Mg2+ transporter-C (MgtC) family protein [Actinacidiphila guanduensis]
MHVTHPLASVLWDPGGGQGLRQLGELGLALLLSTLIGLERAVQQKSAGLRTHTLVGVGAALFMEVSQHGFGTVLGHPGVVLDPSRIAAQVVSGIGFIGGGLIFVRRDAVRGLTTAATIWLTAAIGMACGGGLVLLAVVATAGHFLVVRVFPLVTGRFPALAGPGQTDLQISYRVGAGVLARILERCTGSGFRVTSLRVDRAPWSEDGDERPAAAGSAQVQLSIEGTGDVPVLVTDIAEVDGVLGVWSPTEDAAYWR